MLKYLCRRLEERSTWAGLSAAAAAGLGALASVSGVSPWIINSLAGLVAVGGLVAAILPSRPGAEQ